MKDGKHMSDVVTPDPLEATQVIHGVPHPDPRLRPDQVSIQIPAAFWARLRRHIERSQEAPGSAAERALWEQWLTPAGVQAVTTVRTWRQNTAGLATALERLRTTILESLQRPLTLRIDPEPASRNNAAAEPRYLLVLSNGATLVLRISSRLTGRDIDRPLDANSATATSEDHLNPNPTSPATPARLEDCFFTRAATDIARNAGDLALPASSDGTKPAEPVDDSRLRKAVVREWVGRYALVVGEGNLTGLVPPDRPCEFNRAGDGGNPDLDPRTVRFLIPTAWGFRGGPSGCRWEGFSGSSTGSAYGEEAPAAVRQLLDQRVGKRGNGVQDSGFRVQSSGGKAGDERPADDRVDGVDGPEPWLALPRYRLPWLNGDLSSPSSSAPDSARSSRYSVTRAILRDAFACLPEMGGAMRQCRRAWAGSADGPAAGDAPATAPAAYELAVALGRCRLLGAESTCTDSLNPSGFSASADLTLAPPVALAAARELSSRLERWGQRAEGLVDQLEGATPVRAADLCLGLLEARIEAWAAYLAIDESYSAAVDGAAGDAGDARNGSDLSAGAASDAFSGEMDALLDRMQAFDDAIEAVEPLLAVAASAPGSRLLENWRALLADPYRQSPPWWLDVATSHAHPNAADEAP